MRIATSDMEAQAWRNEGQQLRKKELLIVEDSALVAQIVSMVNRAYGYRLVLLCDVPLHVTTWL